VSWSRQVLLCAQACDALAAEGIDVELIDLRSIWPWDRECVLHLRRQNRPLLVVHEAIQVAGFGAEIAATVAEATGARVKRLGAPRIPVGYSPVLEAQSRISPETICAAAVRTMLAHNPEPRATMHLPHERPII
jgi:pyruvate/2-oxoglutarate/acetoin dehydrogenase E1 component